MSLTGDLDPFAHIKRRRRRSGDVPGVTRVLDTREGLEQLLSHRHRQPVTICPTTGELSTGLDKLRERAGSMAREAFDTPPSRLTGVITQKPLGGLVSDPLIDWVTVTFRGSDALDIAKIHFGAGLDTEWVDMGRGGYGYASSLKRGQVTIYHGGNVNPDTVSVVVSGSGCRQLESEGLIGGPNVLLRGASPWEAWLYDLVEVGATFARCDVALDDRTGLLDMQTMLESVKNGDCSTRFKRAKCEDEYDPSTGACVNQIIRFGSRQSLMYVRIYHKGLEQLEKGSSEEPENWIRCEIESRDERADKLVEQIIRHGMRSVASILWSYIDFKTPDSHDDYRKKDRYLRDTASWWLEFINRVEKTRLGVAPRVVDVRKMITWLRRQVAPTLHVVVNACSIGWDLVSALVSEGGGRLKSHHINALVAYNMKGRHLNALTCVSY